MKMAERIIMVLIVAVVFGGVGWLYVTYQKGERELRDAVARGEYQIPLASSTKATDEIDWRTFYPELIPIIIGSTTVQASVADTIPERIKGLSDTPFLPEGVVKLFAFGSAGEQSIWMKDMNYPIDIMWLAKDGKIVHIEENVSPDTYPESFSSPTPAWYVIEANAGFVASNSLKRGDEVIVPN
jgi:uncharacterized protein